MNNKKERLLDLILERSFRYDPDFGFHLASGKKSDIYIDLKQVTTMAEGASLIGEIVYDMVSDLPVAAVGGLTLGADPIAYAVMFTSISKSKTIDAFVIRKNVKAHGTGNMVEGSVKKGDNVVIIDDVVTTGGSTIEAIKKAVDGGLNVVKVVSVVDREEGGAEAVKKHVKDYLSVFTRSDLIRRKK